MRHVTVHAHTRFPSGPPHATYICKPSCAARPCRYVSEANVTALWAKAVEPAVARAVAARVAADPNAAAASLSDVVAPATSRKMPMFLSSVTAVNRVGGRVTSYSNGTFVDALPPITGRVVDGANETLGDLAIQYSASSLGGHWVGFVDKQSGVARYVVDVLDVTGGGAAVLRGQDVGRNTSVVFDGMSLSNGHVYALRVSCYDAAGNVAVNVSNGVTVDTTPPVLAWARDDDVAGGNAGAYRNVAENFSLPISWAGVDAESGIARYEWRVCASVANPGDVCVREWVAVRPNTTSVRTATLALVPGVHYIAQVRATNGVGLQAIAASSGFAVSVDDPAPGDAWAVDAYAAADAAAADAGRGGCVGCAHATLPTLRHLGAWDAIGVQWSGFTDPVAPIDHYEVFIGSGAGLSDIVSPVRVGLTNVAVLNASGSAAFARAGGGLANITHAHMTVRAVNAAGRSALAYADPVQVDVTRPLAGPLFSGEDGTQDVPYTRAPERLCVSAEGWVDHDSGVDHYAVAIGSSPGNASIVAWRPVAAVVEDVYSTVAVLCVGGLALAHEQVVYAGVRAYNPGGLFVEKWASRTMVVLRPPGAGVVWDVTNLTAATRDVDIMTSTQTVAAVWTAFGGGDACPIVEYAVALCSAVTGCNMPGDLLSSYIPRGTARNVSYSGVGLEEGVLYVFHVTATNAAGLVSEAVSDGFIIDASGPSSGTVEILSVARASYALSDRGLNFTDAPLSDGDIAIARSLIIADGPLLASVLVPMHVYWCARARIGVCVCPMEVELGDVFLCVAALGDTVVDGDRIGCAIVVWRARIWGAHLSYSARIANAGMRLPYGVRVT